MLVCCGVVIGEGGRLLARPRRGCIGKSCRFVRFGLRGGLAVVGGFVVVGVVLAGVVLAVVCGVVVGGIAGAAHSVPPGVRSHIGVGVGGIAGSAHKVPPGVLSPSSAALSSVVGALAIVVGSVGVFACIGVGGVSGFGFRLSVEVAAAGVEASALFADLTIPSQLIAKGKLSSGLPKRSR